MTSLKEKKVRFEDTPTIYLFQLENKTEDQSGLWTLYYLMNRILIRYPREELFRRACGEIIGEQQRNCREVERRSGQRRRVCTC